MSATEFVHAAKVCSQMELGIMAAACRAQQAILEAKAEIQTMLGILNEGRADRGLPPLDVHLTQLGDEHEHRIKWNATENQP